MGAPAPQPEWTKATALPPTHPALTPAAGLRRGGAPQPGSRTPRPATRPPLYGVPPVPRLLLGQQHWAHLERALRRGLERALRKGLETKGPAGAVDVDRVAARGIQLPVAFASLQRPASCPRLRRFDTGPRGHAFSWAHGGRDASGEARRSRDLQGRPRRVRWGASGSA